MVKKCFSTSKVGHAGTLDPEAQGVLPIAIGEATKLISVLADAKKKYSFTIQFGTKTDTADIAGKVIASNNKVPTYKQLVEVLPTFQGNLQQKPHNYSAIKINGRRAYSLARANIPFAIKPRDITVYEIKLINFDDKLSQATIEATVSKGTYIRTLAEDVAAALDSLGFVIALHRTEVGLFKQEDAINITEYLAGDWLQAQLLFTQSLFQVESVLADVAVTDVENDVAWRVKCGQQVLFDGGITADKVWLRNNGSIIAIGSLLLGRFQCERVFNVNGN